MQALEGRPTQAVTPAPAESDKNSLKELRQKDGALVTDDALPSAEEAA